jgi:uroporphyrinogen-III decarboxylase
MTIPRALEEEAEVLPSLLAAGEEAVEEEVRACLEQFEGSRPA